MWLAAPAPGCGLRGLPSLLWPAGSSLFAVTRGVFPPCCGLRGLPSMLWRVRSSVFAVACRVFPPCCGLWGLPSLLWPAGSSVFAVAYGVFPPCCGLRGLPSLLWPAGTLAAACGLFIVRHGIWFPDQEWNPGNPSLGAQSLSHWTIKEVPFIDFVYLLSLISSSLAIIT